MQQHRKSYNHTHPEATTINEFIFRSYRLRLRAVRCLLHAFPLLGSLTFLMCCPLGTGPEGTSPSVT